jgi:single-strand DNA-binding protein
MASVNKVVMVGRLVRDPEKKELDGDKVVVRMSLAVDSNTKEKNTQFFNVTVWNKLGEVCAANLSKGRLVYVEGRLNNRSWEKDGQTHYATDIVANEVQFLDSKKKAEGASDTADEKEEDPSAYEPSPF